MEPSAVLAAIGDLRSRKRRADVDAIAQQLGADVDRAELAEVLLDLARRGHVWMIAAWWTESAPDEMTFTYHLRRSDPEDDLA